jgi:hypothetical protein
MADMPTIT